MRALSMATSGLPSILEEGRVKDDEQLLQPAKLDAKSQALADLLSHNMYQQLALNHRTLTNIFTGLIGTMSNRLDLLESQVSHGSKHGPSLSPLPTTPHYANPQPRLSPRTSPGFRPSGKGIDDGVSQIYGEDEGKAVREFGRNPWGENNNFGSRPHPYPGSNGGNMKGSGSRNYSSGTGNSSAGVLPTIDKINYPKFDCRNCNENFSSLLPIQNSEVLNGSSVRNGLDDEVGGAEFGNGVGKMTDKLESVGNGEGAKAVIEVEEKELDEDIDVVDVFSEIRVPSDKVLDSVGDEKVEIYENLEVDKKEAKEEGFVFENCDESKSPDMENFLQSGFPLIMPKMDYDTNQFVQTPISISDINLRQEQMMADFVSQRAREQEHIRLPPMNFDVVNAVNPNVLNADQFSSMLPLAGKSSQKKASGSMELAENALARATQVFVKRQPEIHLFTARFKEQHGDISGARSAYQFVHTGISPGLLEAIIKHANMEQRLGKLEDACSLYEQAIAIEKGKEQSQALPLLSAQSSRFIFLVSGNVDKAREILVRGVESEEVDGSGIRVLGTRLSKGGSIVMTRMEDRRALGALGERRVIG